MPKKPYTRESLERALVHHRIDYSPPHVGKPQWRVGHGLDAVEMPEAMVYAYVLGLAEGERRYRHPGAKA